MHAHIKIFGVYNVFIEVQNRLIDGQPLPWVYGTCIMQDVRQKR